MQRSSAGRVEPAAAPRSPVPTAGGIGDQRPPSRRACSIAGREGGDEQSIVAADAHSTSSTTSTTGWRRLRSTIAVDDTSGRRRRRGSVSRTCAARPSAALVYSTCRRGRPPRPRRAVPPVASGPSRRAEESRTADPDPRRDASHASVKPCQLGRPADQAARGPTASIGRNRCTDGDRQRRDPAPGSRRSSARSSGPGSSPNSSASAATRPLERDQGVVLPARRVQRPHQQAPRPLPPGMLGDEPLQIAGRRLDVAPDSSRASARSSTAAARALRRDAARSWTANSTSGEVRRTASPATRPNASVSTLTAPGEVAGRRAGGAHLTASRSKTSASTSTPSSAKPVAARRRLDQLAVRQPDERAAQPGHVGLDRLRRCRRRITHPRAPRRSHRHRRHAPPGSPSRAKRRRRWVPATWTVVRSCSISNGPSTST